MGRNWARDLAQKIDPAKSEVELNALRQLLDDILMWAATMEATGGEHHWGRGPWSLRGALDANHKRTPQDPVRLAEQLNEEQAMTAFNQLVRYDNGEPIMRTGASLYEELHRAQHPASEAKGIGHAIAAVYHACRTS
jgi:hypothetical protein